MTCSFLPNTTPTCFATFYSDEKEKLHWKKCAMRYCSCVTDLLLLGKTANYCSCTDQLLLMHRPTIAHALTEQLLLTHRQQLLTHRPTIAHALAEQLLVGYPPTIDHIMGNNTASRNTYYWSYTSYIWPSTDRIIFWVYVIKIERENEKKEVSVGFGKRL
jgi:hypothetical protein